jgi:hypothetical protein
LLTNSGEKQQLLYTFKRIGSEMVVNCSGLWITTSKIGTLKTREKKMLMGYAASSTMGR